MLQLHGLVCTSKTVFGGKLDGNVSIFHVFLIFKSPARGVFVRLALRAVERRRELSVELVLW